jgi:hypothetical protein
MRQPSAWVFAVAPVCGLVSSAQGSVEPASCVPDLGNPASLQRVGKFAFLVDDLTEVRATLKQRDIPILLASDDSVIVKDNDGNWVQFFQQSPNRTRGPSREAP